MKKTILIFIFFAFQVVNSQNLSNSPAITDSNSIYNTSTIDVLPEYPGGINEFYKFVGKNYKVPNVQGLSGKIFVCFVVEKNGKLSDIKVIRDLGFGTGEEAIRILKKCKKWSPGFQNGKEVRVQYSLPINIISS